MQKQEQEPTKFDQFVRGFGVEELARRLDVNPSGIYHWLSGSTSPRRVTAFAIQELAAERGVALSLDEIYQHFRDVRRKRFKTPSLKPQHARI